MKEMKQTNIMDKHEIKIDKKIKVGQYIGGLGTGGIENLVMDIFDNIDSYKYQFDFIVDIKEPSIWDKYIKERGGKIVSVFEKDLKYGSIKRKFIKAKKMLNLFKKQQYDVVHIHMSFPSTLLYCWLAKRAGVKLVIAHAHASSYGNVSIVEKIVSKLSILLFKNSCDCLIGVSNQAGKFMYGPNSNFLIVNNGIDMQKFKFNSYKRNLIREQLGIKKDTFVIGHVGRFAEAKNHKFIIEVVSKLKKENVKLLLVGEGKLKDDIIKLAEEYDIKEKVIFYGYSNKVEDLFNAMDAFFFPSLFEGLGVVAIEAQASGLETIISDTVPDEVLITDSIKKIGLNKPINIWTDSLYKIIKNEPFDIEKRKKCSEANITLLEKNNFGIKKTAKLMENIYSSF